MDDHEHDYRKLSDEAVFCRGCGDIKSVAPAVCALPHYPVYPWVVQPYPPTYYPWWGTTTTGTITVGNTVQMSDDNAVTFTAGALPLTAWPT